MQPDHPVGVPRSFPLSKTKAREVLSRRYRSPGFANVTTPEDKAKGHERWKLYAIDNGARVDILDCAGPADVLPKALVVAGYRHLGFEVEFGTEGEEGKGNQCICNNFHDITPFFGLSQHIKLSRQNRNGWGK